AASPETQPASPGRPLRRLLKAKGPRIAPRPRASYLARVRRRPRNSATIPNEKRDQHARQGSLIPPATLVEGVAPRLLWRGAGGVLIMESLALGRGFQCFAVGRTEVEDFSYVLPSLLRTLLEYLDGFELGLEDVRHTI